MQSVCQITPEHIANMRGMLATGNRAAPYLYYHTLTGNKQVINQAMITTGSGIVGGTAMMGNYHAKKENPELYRLTLDQFSSEIVSGFINAVERDVNEGGSGYLTDREILQADHGVWVEKGLGRYFPGNVYEMSTGDFWKQSAGDLSSSARDGVRSAFGLSTDNHASLNDLPGAANGLEAVFEGHALGVRPYEFTGPQYVWTETKDLLVITDTQTDSIVCVWGKDSDFNRPVENLVESITGSVGWDFNLDTPGIMDMYPLQPGSELFQERAEMQNYMGFLQEPGTPFNPSIPPPDIHYLADRTPEVIANIIDDLPEPTRSDAVEVEVQDDLDLLESPESGIDEGDPSAAIAAGDEPERFELEDFDDGFWSIETENGLSDLGATMEEPENDLDQSDPCGVTEPGENLELDEGVTLDQEEEAITAETMTATDADLVSDNDADLAQMTLIASIAEPEPEAEEVLPDSEEGSLSAEGSVEGEQESEQTEMIPIEFSSSEGDDPDQRIDAQREVEANEATSEPQSQTEVQEAETSTLDTDADAPQAEPEPEVESSTLADAEDSWIESGDFAERATAAPENGIGETGLEASYEMEKPPEPAEPPEAEMPVDAGTTGEAEPPAEAGTMGEVETPVEDDRTFEVEADGEPEAADFDVTAGDDGTEEVVSDVGEGFDLGSLIPEFGTRRAPKDDFSEPPESPVEAEVSNDVETDGVNDGDAPDDGDADGASDGASGDGDGGNGGDGGDGGGDGGGD